MRLMRRPLALTGGLSGLRLYTIRHTRLTHTRLTRRRTRDFVHEAPSAKPAVHHTSHPRALSLSLRRWLSRGVRRTARHAKMANGSTYGSTQPHPQPSLPPAVYHPSHPALSLSPPPSQTARSAGGTTGEDGAAREHGTHDGTLWPLQEVCASQLYLPSHLPHPVGANPSYQWRLSHRGR